MVKSGLEIFLEKFPAELRGKRLGILCHASSINRNFEHIAEIFFRMKECRLSAIFGPQHGLFGLTQDNMIEWSGYNHPVFNIPVFSLYGKHRKPTERFLENIDALIVDLQDVGARLYTYVWTMKLCTTSTLVMGV